MKILFIYPNLNLAPRINHGLAALLAFIKKRGHFTSLIQINTKGSFKELNNIKKINPDIIAFSACTNQWGVAKFLAEEIKRKYDIKIFAGGPHPTVYPECILETKAIDGICRGEGEFPLTELLKRLSDGSSINSVPNFWIRDGENIIRNEISSLIENLDGLPIPEWNLFDDTTIYSYPSFSFSRGCIFACQYCINSALRNIYNNKGTYVRIKSVNKAMEEIKDKVSKYHLKILNFDDDVFLKNKEWISKFCQRYQKEISLPFNFNARPENITKDICAMLKEAGAKMVGMGIESGDAEIRREILGRPLSDETIIRAFKVVSKAGLDSYAFNMIGIPGETVDKFKKTIRLNKEILPTDLQISIFYPFLGTPLGEFCLRKGYMKHESAYGFFEHTILDLPGFPPKEIHRWFDRFEYVVYKDTNFKKAIKFRLSKFLKRYALINFVTKPFINILKKISTLLR